MFGRLFQALFGKHDRAIIHKTVPDEVLYPDGRPKPEEIDDAWLTSLPAVKPTHAALAAKPVPVGMAPPPARQSGKDAPPANRPAPNMDYSRLFIQAPNRTTDVKPRCPLGWLVVVDGPDVGEWFVLERGVSRIGGADSDTIRLKSTVGNVVPMRPVSLGFHEESHIFVLESPTENGTLVNDEPVPFHFVLRDGDVITVGETSLRLASFCSPSFHWEDRHYGAQSL